MVSIFIVLGCWLFRLLVYLLVGFAGWAECLVYVWFNVYGFLLVGWCWFPWFVFCILFIWFAWLPVWLVVVWFCLCFCLLISYWAIVFCVLPWLVLPVILFVFDLIVLIAACLCRNKLNSVGCVLFCLFVYFGGLFAW